MHYRIQRALELMSPCQLCPHKCQKKRLDDEVGYCGIGKNTRIASYGIHLGEEKCISGMGGSGTIFFSGCNLRCVFCQNWEISQGGYGKNYNANQLAEIMLELQHAGAHNVNLVTPSHVIPQILEALNIAVKYGFELPLVYNCGGYESIESLYLLDGIVDIYMPDFKFWDSQTALTYLHVSDYAEKATLALKEMYRQVGDLIIVEGGIAKRGLLVRHLVMPNNISGTESIARWIAKNISKNTYLNLMNQYHPAGEVLRSVNRSRFVPIARPVNAYEMDHANNRAKTCGLHRFDQPIPDQIEV